MNPFQVGYDDMVRLLETEFTLSTSGIKQIKFYGAGCAFPDKNKIVSDALSQHFGITDVEINSDLLAAARSLCGKSPGVACILGPGSNSCYYDGEKIVHNVSPLGYVLGDEGSGSVLGRKLLSDVLKNQLSEQTRKLFFDTYNTTVGEILDNVYRKPLPNRYLAQYTKFLAANIEIEEIRSLASGCFREFFVRNVLQYNDAKNLPINFTGSIAYYFNAVIKEVALELGFNVGKITQEPMDGLENFHNDKL
jgi:hypothetical protein